MLLLSTNVKIGTKTNIFLLLKADLQEEEIFFGSPISPWLWFQFSFKIQVHPDLHFNFDSDFYLCYFSCFFYDSHPDLQEEESFFGSPISPWFGFWFYFDSGFPFKIQVHPDLYYNFDSDFYLCYFYVFFYDFHPDLQEEESFFGSPISPWFWFCHSWLH